MNAHVLLSFLLPCVSAFVPGPNPGATYTPSRFRLPVTQEQLEAPPKDADGVVHYDTLRSQYTEESDFGAEEEAPFTGTPLTAQEIADTVAVLSTVNARARVQENQVNRLKNLFWELTPPAWQNAHLKDLPEPALRTQFPDKDFKKLAEEVVNLGLQVHLVKADATSKRKYIQQKDADAGTVVKAKTLSEELVIQQAKNEADMAKIMQELEIQVPDADYSHQVPAAKGVFDILA